MESKWIAKSLTFWGVFITFISAVLPVVGPLIGLDINAADIVGFGEAGTSVINALGGIIGTVMAIIGRMKAKGPATLTGTGSGA